MSDFTPTRSLLNPKFEGYKLLLLDQDNVVRRYRLPYKATQVSSYGTSPLTFQEVQSRITHNHFVLSATRGRGIYVDKNHQVIVVDVADTAADPSFTPVYELPIPIATPQVDPVHPEYPSAAFLDETVVFISDGRGTLYVLDIPISGSATLLASFELANKDCTDSKPFMPFRIHNVIKTGDTTAIALLSSRYYGTHPDPLAKHPMKHHEFDVWAVRFTIPFDMQLGPLAFDVLWRRYAEDVPILMTYHRAQNAYFLLGSSPYRKPSDMHIPPYNPSPDEIAPIPRAGEVLDTEGHPQQTKPFFPYSWTQTSDVVTVAFPLPSTVMTSQIGVAFSQKTLTIHITTSAAVMGLTIPRYSAKPLWDVIRPSTSFWTWDREGEHEYGILMVHLDKQNEGLKWYQVFAASGTSGANADDFDVPETLDPSELYAIRESLEKYTTALKEGEDASGSGLGRGLPTLAQGEMDEEVDSSVGRLAFITWVGEDGSSPAWAASFPDSAFRVLSTPLPGGVTEPLSLVVKTGLDGTRHVLSADLADGSLRWTHENTFSALAFVLASKRDTRFTYHTSDIVFAFENGTQDRGGNVYMYRSSDPKSLWAKQSVLPVGHGDAGSLLGIGAFTSSRAGNTIVCLCENELVILRNVC